MRPIRGLFRASRVDGGCGVARGRPRRLPQDVVTIRTYNGRGPVARSGSHRRESGRSGEGGENALVVWSVGTKRRGSGGSSPFSRRRFWRIAGGGLRDLAGPSLSSRGSGSWSSAAGSKGGLFAGDTRGDVCRNSGMVSVVSKTKKASPPSPSFIEYSCLVPLTRNSTFFSYGRSKENLPKRTWKGEQEREPSSCSTTMTSMAPLRVAGLMEFHAVETESLRFRTYCIVLDCRRCVRDGGGGALAASWGGRWLRPRRAGE